MVVQSKAGRLIQRVFDRFADLSLNFFFRERWNASVIKLLHDDVEGIVEGKEVAVDQNPGSPEKIVLSLLTLDRRIVS